MQSLLERLEQDLVLRKFSPATRRNYLLFARLFLRSLTKSIDDIHEAEIREFLLDQIEHHGRSHASYRQLFAVIKFLFSVTLGRPGEVVRVPFPRTRPQPLPNVLSRPELLQLFEAFTSPKYRALFMTCYAAGLRINEACRLQVTDVDSRQNLIRVRHAKGDHERLTLLTPRLLQELRKYWLLERPRPWLFPAKNAAHPLSTDSARDALAQAALDAGLTPPARRTLCAIRLPPICSKPGQNSSSSRPCWAITRCVRPRGTPASACIYCRRSPVLSTCCPSRLAFHGPPRRRRAEP
jgi:integrase/recombinase XerD